MTYIYLQANGTLVCSDVLKVWKPVGVMVGLSQDAMAMWCNVSMQPLIDAYNDIIHLNMSVSRHIMIEWRKSLRVPQMK